MRPGRSGARRGILEWVASGQQLFRTAPPATPVKHLVVYFVPVDERNRCVGWFGLDERDDWPAGRFGPEMRRFVSKLTAAIGG